MVVVVGPLYPPLIMVATSGEWGETRPQGGGWQPVPAPQSCAATYYLVPGFFLGVNKKSLVLDSIMSQVSRLDKAHPSQAM